MLVGMAFEESGSRKKMPQSTQMLVAAAVTEAVAVLALVLAFVVNIGSPSAVLATFLGFMGLSVIAATLAFILALVGLVRFSRHSVWFLVVIAISVLANPVLWFFLIGYFS